VEPEINLTDPAERRTAARDLQIPPGADIPSTEGMATRVVKGSFWSLVGQVLPLTITLFTAPFVIRLLGTEGYGVLVLINLITTYLSFTDFGMNIGSTKFASEAYAAGARENEGKVVRTAALIALLSSLPFALILFLFSSSVVVFLKVPDHLQPAAGIALKIAAFSLVFTLLGNIFNTPQLSRLRMDLNLIVTVSFKSLGIGATLVLLYLGWGLTGAILATTAAAFLTLAGHILVSGKLLPQLYGFTIDRSSIKPLLKFGGPLVISTIAILLLANLEKLVLARVVSVKALAYYSVAFIFANMATLFSSSMTQSLLPAFSQLLSPEKRDELNSLFIRCLRINLILLFPALILMCVAAKPFFTIWAGEEFGRESTLPFYILLAGLSFNLIAYIPQSLLVASGRTALLAKVYWIEVVPYAILVILCTSMYGIVGAAVAWSLRSFADTFVFIFLVHRVADVKFPSLASGRPVLAALFLSGAIPLLSLALFDSIYITLPVTMICLIAYLPIIWKGFLSDGEREWLRSFLRMNSTRI
jgi:O-antigen/teichoic acid export membrane protein